MFLYILVCLFLIIILNSYFGKESFNNSSRYLRSTRNMSYDLRGDPAEFIPTKKIELPFKKSERYLY